MLSVAEFRTSALFNEREKAALAYTEEMCKTPVAMPDELFERLKQYFTDDQIIELTASIAYENYRARFYHALNIGSEQLYVCAWSPAAAHSEETKISDAGIKA